MDILEAVPGSTLGRCAKILIVAAGGFFLLRLMELQEYLFADADAFTGLIHISGTLYSVLYAFATYVIWGQFIAVENEILKEAGALKDLVLFSRPLKDATRDPIVRAVKSYAKTVIDEEWDTLSRKESLDKTDRLFLSIISSVTEAKPEGDTDRVVFGRLLTIATEASAHRTERLALSVKRIPRTLRDFVLLTATMIFLLLFFYPYHSAPLGVVSIIVTTVLLFFANFVLTDLDNPFEGTWNVNPDAFVELTRAR